MRGRRGVRLCWSFLLAVFLALRSGREKWSLEGESGLAWERVARGSLEMPADLAGKVMSAFLPTIALVVRRTEERVS